MHVFLSEAHPNSVVMAERAPEPGWRELKPTTPPVRSAPGPSRVSLSDLVDAMSTALGSARPLPNSPGDRFHTLAEATLRAGRAASLGEAYSLVSAENPLMWEQVRDAAPKGS
jgi:hypothetical protein